MWLQTISNGGVKCWMQAEACSATKFCHWWPKGLPRAEQGLGSGRFKLNEHMLFMFEADPMGREATWASRKAVLNWEPEYRLRVLAV